MFEFSQKPGESGCTAGVTAFGKCSHKWQDRTPPIPSIWIYVRAGKSVVGGYRSQASDSAGVALFETTSTAENMFDNLGNDVGSVNFSDVSLVVGGGAEVALSESWSIKAEARSVRLRNWMANSKVLHS